MSKPCTSFAFSSNEDLFRDEGDPTREDAILRCIDEESLEIGDKCWTALPKEQPPERLFPSAERILEMISESAYEEVGELSDGWLDTASPEQTKELQNALNAAILAWMTKHNQLPHFWAVEKVQEHEVTEELFRQAYAAQ